MTTKNLFFAFLRIIVVEAVHSERYDNTFVFIVVSFKVVEAVNSERYDNIK